MTKSQNSNPNLPSDPEHAAPDVAASDAPSARGFTFLGTDAADAIADDVIAALRTLPPDASLTSTHAFIAGVLVPAMEALADSVTRAVVADLAEQVTIAELRGLVMDWRDRASIRIARGHTERRIPITAGDDE